MTDRTALSLEVVFKFLDCVTRTLDTATKTETSLDGKLALQRKLKQATDARILLRKNYYAFCDWCQTGEYVTPVVKTMPTCDACGQIKPD